MSEHQRVQKAIDNQKASMKWYVRDKLDFYVAMKWLDYELDYVGFERSQNAYVR